MCPFAYQPNGFLQMTSVVTYGIEMKRGPKRHRPEAPSGRGSALSAKIHEIRWNIAGFVNSMESYENLHFNWILWFLIEIYPPKKIIAVYFSAITTPSRPSAPNTFILKNMACTSIAKNPNYFVSIPYYKTSNTSHYLTLQPTFK